MKATTGVKHKHFEYILKVRRWHIRGVMYLLSLTCARARTDTHIYKTDVLHTHMTGTANPKTVSTKRS